MEQLVWNISVPMILAITHLLPAGVDYVEVQEMITFIPGESVQCFNVFIFGDVEAELNERFFLTLTSDVGQDTANVTILNDDCKTLTFSNVPVFF